MERRLVWCWVVGVMSACSAPVVPVPPERQPPPVASVSESAPPSEVASLLEVVHKGTVDLELLGVRGKALVHVGPVLGVIEADRISFDPALLLGLPHQAMGQTLGRMGGTWPNAVFTAARVGYDENEQEKLFQLRSGRWTAVSGLSKGDEFVAVVPWKETALLIRLAHPEEGRGARQVTELVELKETGEGSLLASVKLDPLQVDARDSGMVLLLGHEEGSPKLVTELVNASGKSTRAVVPVPPDQRLDGMQAALGTASRAWIAGTLMPQDASSVDEKPYLLRWTGSAWEAVQAPFKGKVSTLETDDQGVVWLGTMDGEIWREPGSSKWERMALPSSLEIPAGAHVAAGVAPGSDALWGWVTVVRGEQDVREYLLRSRPLAAPLDTPSPSLYLAQARTLTGPEAWDDGCDETFVLLYELPSTPPAGPRHDKLARALKGKSQLEAARFIEVNYDGKRWLGVQAIEIEDARALVTQVKKLVKGSQPRVTCWAPVVDQAFALDPTKGAMMGVPNE